MPLYEYTCEACGARFEMIRKFSDPPVETCLSCGGPVRKLLSSPAIQFKGSGWYVTDYARKGQAPKAEGATAESAPKDESTPKKDSPSPTESKPSKPSKPAPSE